MVFGCAAAPRQRVAEAEGNFERDFPFPTGVMKHGSNIRRGGGRPPRNNDTNVRRFHGGSGGGGGHRYSNFESSGPEVKIRGSAQQV
ncbi:MAG: hypothetical protein AAB223_04985, partial [Pseudomonadota bacterium]